MNKLPTEKLQKVLAQAGIGSRRECEKIIGENRVSVNGKIVTIGTRVNQHDKIRVDSRVIHNPLRKKLNTRVLIYHKPEGVVCSKVDDKNRPTVYQRLPKLNHGRWIMVGRLDINTSGLLLFTNDGQLADALMHPRNEIQREYAVRVFGDVNNDMLKALIEGVELDDGMAKFDDLAFSGGAGMNKWYHVILHEGRNREVRRLWESQGITVSRLIRVRYGCIELPRHLRIGHYQELDSKKVTSLQDSVHKKSN